MSASGHHIDAWAAVRKFITFHNSWGKGNTSALDDQYDFFFIQDKHIKLTDSLQNVLFYSKHPSVVKIKRGNWTEKAERARDIKDIQAMVSYFNQQSVTYSLKRIKNY